MQNKFESRVTFQRFVLGKLLHLPEDTARACQRKKTKKVASHEVINLIHAVVSLQSRVISRTTLSASRDDPDTAEDPRSADG